MPAPSTEQALSKVRILTSVELFSAGCFFAFAVLYLLLAHSIYLFGSNIFFGTFGMLVWYFWKRPADYIVHANVFLGSVYVGLINVVVHMGATCTPMIFWGLSTSIAAAFILGTTGIFVWVLLGFAFYPLTLGLKQYCLLLSHRAIPLTALQCTLFEFATYAGILFFMAYSFYLFQRKLAQTLSELGKKEVALETLLRVVGHDISNHMTVIGGSTEVILSMLNEPPLSEQSQSLAKVHDLLRGQQKHIRSSAVILKNVKQFSFVRSSNEGLQIDRIDLRDAIQNGLDLVREQYERKNLTVHVTNLCNQAPIVSFNHDNLIHQVLTNILSNAIKFSFQHGRIEIEIWQTPDKVNLSIRDHGMGMPPDGIKDMRFQSRLGTSGEKGTGFGVSIMLAYVEKFGGSVQFQSQAHETHPDQSGTCVTIQFKPADS